MVHRSEAGDTYVDQADTASLRRTYARDPDVIPTGRRGRRNLGRAHPTGVLGGRTVDYVMANHVAEHVPDCHLAGRRRYATCSIPAARFRLVFPDDRFRLMRLREVTRLVDLLQAWVLRARRPQVRDILDFAAARGIASGRTRSFAGTAELATWCQITLAVAVRFRIECPTHPTNISTCTAWPAGQDVCAADAGAGRARIASARL